MRRWHSAAIAADTTPQKGIYQRFQTATRDQLLKDNLIPQLIHQAAAFHDAKQGPILLAHMKALLEAACKAADCIRWCNPAVVRVPSLRNYGLANALWLGVQGLWATIRPSIRAQLDAHSLSPQSIVTTLKTYLDSDIKRLCEQKETSDVKLLQFWLVQLGKLLQAYPEAACAVYDAVGAWSPKARQAMAELGHQGDDRVEALLAAVDGGVIWARAARLQAQSLSCMASCEADTRSSALASGCSEDVWHVLTAAQMLGQAGVLSEAARSRCTVVLRAVLQNITAAAAWPAMSSDPDVRQTVIDGCLTLCLSCYDHDQVSQWMGCQLALMEYSLHPHPVMLTILSSVWASLTKLTDPTTVEQFIAALHELLKRSAAVEASAGFPAFQSQSPLVSQLSCLLASVLYAAPTETSEVFFNQHMQLRQGDKDDLCRLAILAALLRAGAIVHMGAPNRNAYLEKLSSTTCRHLCSALLELVSKSKLDPPAQRAVADVGPSSKHAAWMCECIAKALQCLEHSVVRPQQSTAGVARDAAQALLPLLFVEDPLATSALHAFEQACRVSPEAILVASRLQDTLPRLVSMIESSSPAAPYVMRLAAAYREVSLPPKPLFAAMLGDVAPHKSAVLRLLAMESYVAYVRGCERSNVVGVLPPRLIDASTGATTPAFAQMVTQHLTRTMGDNNANGRSLDKHSACKAAMGGASKLEVQATGAPRKLFELASKMRPEVKNSQQACDGHTAKAQQKRAHTAGMNEVIACAADIQHALQKIETVAEKHNIELPTRVVCLVRECRRELDTYVDSKT
jgi:hypothetical protein